MGIDSSSTLLALALIPSFLLFFWTMSATSSPSPSGLTFPNVRNKRICLLIAHPDDEAMFFAPTLLAMTRPESGNHLKILCLSSGNADGLGHIRKDELKASALRLGLRSESDVFVVDDPSRFPDSMTTTWSASDIATLLASAFAPELSSTTNGSSKSTKKPPNATIDILITFDQSGVSNHPNHRSLYHGARTFLQNLMKDKSGYTCPVTLYTLTSTNILRKYIGVLDAPFSMVHGLVGAVFDRKRSSSTAKDKQPKRLLFVSSIGDWLAAVKAMVRAHKSQMVWFRWGWVSIGRYMVVNDLKREKI
ncbi:N-acetylglucosaminyl-phosphatidylinositol de-N-acetylase [Paracoccidioides lutzii Pb01]|uniref:N-acetylglucosaminylphosphatidylinositol deacetylase n=1 Tax=Paracoccidioides lutzii (strain ATCC MYA-826 / Pb01) TaxID=502779 RepID=C1GV47_PARBA|nr:N-acetylglucosaminyl-phosphatidylinositol de-N-acetylase [Paracoccidioides lutzii Pb01]EEH40465.1 N-acetylglucosaminyl-phosphatidylinositol de-N-acetylase [Paracoccidioides lutzii Pb01]